MRTTDTLKKAVLIQYSAQNAIETLRQLWKLTNADIELYIVDESHVLKPRQKARVDYFLATLEHDLRSYRGATSNGSLKIFRYSAPGSLRCILLQDEMLSLGSYLYEWKKTEKPYPEGLDIRGGEKPTILIRRDDPEFSAAQSTILDLVKNWKLTKLAKCVAEFSRDEKVRKWHRSRHTGTAAGA
jgi:hypothetical protein